MFRKTAQYTCVFTCLIAISPCLGESAGKVSMAAANDESAPKADTPDFNEVAARSKATLEKALHTNEEIYANLRSFVCSEEIQRFKGSLGTANGKQIDTVTATVSFENGTEHYSDIRQNARVRPRMSSLDGAWSEGEFGTLLRQTQLAFSTQTPNFERYENLDGVSTAVYVLDVVETESPWDLEVRSQHFRVPFRTRVWVSETSSEILKIERISTYIPSQVGISEISWNVNLKEVDLNGKTWLLPNTGEYSVTYQESGHREWNLMQFSNYHRYGSEVEIRFQ